MKQLIYIITAIVLFSSCVKNNPDPAWLEVNEWTLNSNVGLTGAEGELSHSFTEAWVYIDDQIVGVFEVPFKIPILKTGDVNIKLYPAVKNNGISATKKIYPFTEVFSINTTLVKNQTLTLNPTTRYSDQTQFWIEDFEDAAIKIITDPNSQTSLVAGNDPAILEYGNYYGGLTLTEIDSTWVAYSEQLSNNLRGKEVYLEIDYYNTNALVSGLLAITASSTLNNQNVQLNPQTPENVKWKKIYIDLREVISNSDPTANFRLSFQALLDTDDSEGLIILDNIKVVHF